MRFTRRRIDEIVDMKLDVDCVRKQKIARAATVATDILIIAIPLTVLLLVFAPFGGSSGEGDESTQTATADTTSLFEGRPPAEYMEKVQRSFDEHYGKTLDHRIVQGDIQAILGKDFKVYNRKRVQFDFGNFWEEAIQDGNAPTMDTIFDMGTYTELIIMEL